MNVCVHYTSPRVIHKFFATFESGVENEMGQRIIQENRVDIRVLPVWNGLLACFSI